MVGDGVREYFRLSRESVYSVDNIPEGVRLGAFIVLGTLMLLGQWAMITFGDTGQTRFFVDARDVWLPLAEGVLSDGAPLYGPDQWDNKPPLWQFVNIGVAALGPYYIIFYALIGVAHGIAAYLVSVWVRRAGYDRIGLVSALFFMSAVPLVFAARINPRPFAEIALFIAILTASRSGAVSGVSLSVATLFSQFSIFAAPIIAWRAVGGESRQRQFQWLIAFGSGGIAIAALSYGIVWFIWGTETLEYSIRYSILWIVGYESTSPALTSPITIIGGHAVHLTQIYFLVLPALVGIRGFYRDGWNWSDLRGVCILFIVVLSIPLLIRPGGIYLYPPLPFVAVLATFGLSEIFD
jgi:hypothetical protein